MWVGPGNEHLGFTSLKSEVYSRHLRRDVEQEVAGIQVRNSEKQAGLGVSIWNHLEAMGLGKANKRDSVDADGRRVCTEHGALPHLPAAPVLFH